MAIEENSKIKLTYAEYRCFPSDGQRHEIIDGDHFVNLAPNTYHQTISGRLYFQLFEQVESKGRGRVFSAPTDLQLTETDIVQPDLIVLTREQAKMITPTKIKGTPQIVAEILSASTADTDRVLKKELYRRTGVAEYWVVDPNEQRVEQFVLSAESYELAGSHSKTLTSKTFAEVDIDLTRIW